jgi:hypothetical protein
MRKLDRYDYLWIGVFGIALTTFCGLWAHSRHLDAQEAEMEPAVVAQAPVNRSGFEKIQTPEDLKPYDMVVLKTDPDVDPKNVDIAVMSVVGGAVEWTDVQRLADPGCWVLMNNRPGQYSVRSTIYDKDAGFVSSTGKFTIPGKVTPPDPGPEPGPGPGPGPDPPDPPDDSSKYKLVKPAYDAVLKLPANDRNYDVKVVMPDGNTRSVNVVQAIAACYHEVAEDIRNGDISGVADLSKKIKELLKQVLGNNPGGWPSTVIEPVGQKLSDKWQSGEIPNFPAIADALDEIYQGINKAAPAAFSMVTEEQISFWN